MAGLAGLRTPGAYGSLYSEYNNYTGPAEDDEGYEDGEGEGDGYDEDEMLFLGDALLPTRQFMRQIRHVKPRRRWRRRRRRRRPYKRRQHPRPRKRRRRRRRRSGGGGGGEVDAEEAMKAEELAKMQRELGQVNHSLFFEGRSVVPPLPRAVSRRPRQDRRRGAQSGRHLHALLHQARRVRCRKASKSSRREACGSPLLMATTSRPTSALRRPSERRQSAGRRLLRAATNLLLRRRGANRSVWHTSRALMSSIGRRRRSRRS